jgi:uncharacterized membrane protein AbrB (regulator of aidB expression)
MREAISARLARQPWIGLLIALALGVAVAVALVREEIRLPPRGTEQIGLFLFGALITPALVSAVFRVKHKQLQIAATLIALALAAAGLYMGLGWARGTPGVDPATFPRGEQSFGAGSFAGFLVVFVALVCQRLGRFLAGATSAKS